MFSCFLQIPILVISLAMFSIQMEGAGHRLDAKSIDIKYATTQDLKIEFIVKDTKTSPLSAKKTIKPPH